MQSLLFSFEGRVNRAKFWLINVGLWVVEVILFGVAFGGAALQDPAAMSSSLGIGGIIVLLLFIPIFWVALAVGVKRWHDRGKSGWWVLIALVPVIGGLWYLIECGFLKGTTGANKFGPDPLAAVG